MKLRFPTPYTVLLIVTAIAAILTWLVPAGNYNSLSYDEAGDRFQVTTPDGVTNLPATESTLDSLGILIDLQTFTSGELKRAISVPGSYAQVESDPQGIVAVISAPIKGMYEVIDIVLLVLIIGGFIGVFNSSGVLDKGIAALAKLLRGRESLLIVIVTTLIALGGTTFGMAEETLAFFPILVPVFLAAGYDLMVPMAVIFIGSSFGTMASTTNPFATIIASNAAGVDWTVGLSSRLAMLGIGLVICITYITHYANRVKNDPTRSLIPEGAFTNPFAKTSQHADADTLKPMELLQIIYFGATFVMMVVGVSLLGWWLTEMTALFLGATLLSYVFHKTGEKLFVKSFIDGAKDLLGVTFIIGIARGVTIIMNDGRISDTILYEAAQILQGTDSLLLLPMMLVAFFGLGFLISSSSGLAVVSMPIMSSLGQLLGIPTEEIVNAYQFGFGLVILISPTALVLPSLAMVNINYDTWLRFMLPLLGILTLLALGILWMGFYF